LGISHRVDAWRGIGIASKNEAVLLRQIGGVVAQVQIEDPVGEGHARIPIYVGGQRPDATSGRARANTLDEDYTILSTIHSAKGQEWRIVRILNVVDGCIPSDMATRADEEIEEERRLLYVAMTRAKDELDLIVPQRFYTYQQSKTGDRHVYACGSRFIPDAVVDRFECRGWREGAQESKRPTKKPGSTTDVATSLLRMWR
jgi:DNA helicase-2/ATP-dependent DNA helicase PcrA